MTSEKVARHWARRIVVEFAGYEDLTEVARQLLAGEGAAVYQQYRHLEHVNITDVPGKPIKLYFLKELVQALRPFYTGISCREN